MFLLLLCFISSLFTRHCVCVHFHLSLYMSRHLLLVMVHKHMNICIWMNMYPLVTLLFTDMLMAMHLRLYAKMYSSMYVHMGQSQVE